MTLQELIHIVGTANLGLTLMYIDKDGKEKSVYNANCKLIIGQPARITLS